MKTRRYPKMRRLTAVVVVACVAVLLPCVANGAGNQGVNEPIPLAAPLDKAALTADIVSTFRPETEARGYDLSLWEAELRGVLAARTESQLLSAKNATSWAEAKRILGFSGEARAASSQTPSRRANSVAIPTFGDPATNLVYFPVEPCRIVDTRIGTGANLGPISGFRNIFVNGSLTAQGGKAAGCGIPTDPAAVALNVVAVTPPGSGYIEMYPYLSAEPTASILNFTGGQNVANMIIMPQCQICGLDITYAVFSSSAHLVIDVVGYFWSPTPQDGLPATGRGYALVVGTTTLLNSRGFSSVSNPVPGEFCLVPTFDWTGVKTAPVVSTDWSNSFGNPNQAQWRSSGAGCPAGQIDVLTFNFGALPTGTQTNEAFTIFVP
jgi:hypothetical protein